jgi:hypothetical protein
MTDRENPIIVNAMNGQTFRLYDVYPEARNWSDLKRDWFCWQIQTPVSMQFLIVFLGLAGLLLVIAGLGGAVK